MIHVAVIGAGKMGISHLAILGAHTHVQITGVCDTSSLVTDALARYSPFPCFNDHRKMLAKIHADAVIVAVPTKFHASIVQELLELGKHVFVEKPFCMTAAESASLAALAESKGLVNQVGYHNRFIGTFSEAKRIIEGGWLGEIYHFHGQSYGPVVIRPSTSSWRSNTTEGGGCLMDYASHVIDLIQFLLGPVTHIHTRELRKIFSAEVEDAVYAVMTLANDINGMLSVNWSDETHRKMTTSIQLNGVGGKLIADANELKVYFKGNNVPEEYDQGWNVRYVTDLSPSVDFYLRGEEYSAQLDYFIRQIEKRFERPLNSFRSAAQTDKAISLLKAI